MKFKECPHCHEIVLPNAKGLCPRCGKYARNKNHAVIVALGDGRKARSRGEAERYNHLLWKQTAGHISGLVLRPKPVSLTPSMRWDVDFFYFEERVPVWEEFKGKEERDYLLKRDLWTYVGPGLLRVVKRDPRTRLFHVEDEIRPFGLAYFHRQMAQLGAKP